MQIGAFLGGKKGSKAQISWMMTGDGWIYGMKAGSRLAVKSSYAVN